jgi:nucleoside-diphosphate-sugar epimerase
MKALITGGSGFFGLHLARLLRDAGWDVRATDTVPFPIDEVSGVDFLAGDIRDEALMRRACRGAEAVFHCASLVPVTRSGEEFIRVNVDGTRNVLEACRQEAVRKVVHISSSAVYGRPSEAPLDEASPAKPLGRYGESKKLAEDVCRQYKMQGLDITMIRPRTLVGSGRLGILQLLFDWISLGKNFYILGAGDNQFQLLSAHDCAQACLLAGSRSCFQEDFNLGAERFGTLRADLEGLAAHAGTGSRIVSLSPLWTRPILRALDVLRLSPLVDWHYQTLDADWSFDIAKAKAVLGWQPRDSNLAMLTSAYDWFIAHRDQRPSSSAVSAHRRPVLERLLRLLKWVS